MIVRIGVSNTAKELELELADDVDAEAVKADVATALAVEEGMLWLTDKQGRQVGVPSAKVAYVDLGTPSSTPKIGFGA